MTDEMDLAPVVRSWFRETLPPASESSHVFDAAIREARTKRQQRHPWPPLPLPSTRPSGRDRVHDDKAQTAMATENTGYRPSPIPATNGHAPTVIGRTQTMFSPVKAITAGALVFAIGGVFLIAQPFDQGGSVPGAEQGAEPAAPVEVTGTFVRFDCHSDGSVEVDGYVTRTHGETCTVYQEWSDPRLQGTETYVANGMDFLDESGLYVGHYVHNIVTDDGAWRMRPQFRIESMDGPENFSGTWVLDGEGAYEGLSVVFAKDELTSAPLIGYIISTDLVPPAPEGASTK